MKHFNPRNERIKRDYFRYLKEADQKAEATIDSVRKAIARFESYTGLKDLATFNKEQAIAFKKSFARARIEGNEPLAKSTLLSTINALKAFFKWLSWQPGYRSRIKPTDIEYLNLSDNETRAAKAPRFKSFPTLEQVRAVLGAMPAETEVDRRDRALIAFAILTGMRDAALASLPLKHVDLDRALVVQDPREVKTKRRKRIDTFFFPVGADIEKIAVDWIRFLREKKLYGNDDPVFPSTAMGHDENCCFAIAGLAPRFWSNTGPIRKIFRMAFARAGLPYFNPHSFRDTLVQLGERICPTIEHFKAWSQNLGHEHVQTTLTSYGSVAPHRQGELVRSVVVNGVGVGMELDRETLNQLKRLIDAVRSAA
jgi:integrase